MRPINLAEVNELEIAPGIFGRIVTGGTVTVMHVRLESGATAPEHSHHHEQVVNVIEGELELTVEGEKHILPAGHVFDLKPNLRHSAHVRIPTKVIDVFHPVREDFASGKFAGYGKK